jgi:hypothetical protein
MPWQPPSLSLKWGSYVKPDEQSQLFVVQAVQAALGGSGGTQIITKRLALNKLKQAGVFEIENISAVLESLQEEADENANRELDAAKAALDAQAGAQRPGKDAPPNASGSGGGGGRPPSGKVDAR